MGGPVRALMEVAHLKNSSELVGFTLSDATILNMTLGLFEKNGIRIALLNVVDEDTQIPVRFDSEGTGESILERWNCIKYGRMFLYFDDHELLGLITKTVKTKFFFKQVVIYQAYMATPLTAILIGKPTTDFDTALEWLEMRYRKCVEVLPSLQEEHEPMTRATEKKFQNMGGAGEIFCVDCGYAKDIVSSTQGQGTTDGQDIYNMGYQCQSCGDITHLVNSFEDRVEQACKCGSTIARDCALFCPQCRSKNLRYEIKYLT